jgi:class 3 adenylate cyclase
VLGERVEAERRQVTVLFTDMVGFTTFPERSGEEAAFTLDCRRLLPLKRHAADSNSTDRFAWSQVGRCGALREH